MGLKTGGKNAMLSAFAAQNGYASLHSGFPATAANEISGGTPAYARKAISWAAPDTGSMAASTQPTFDVPPGTTIMAVGYCASDVEGANDINGDDDLTNETYTGQGTYKLDSATVTL